MQLTYSSKNAKLRHQIDRYHLSELERPRLTFRNCHPRVRLPLHPNNPPPPPPNLARSRPKPNSPRIPSRNIPELSAKWPQRSTSALRLLRPAPNSRLPPLDAAILPHHSMPCPILQCNRHIALRRLCNPLCGSAVSCKDRRFESPCCSDAEPTRRVREVKQRLLLGTHHCW